MPTRLLILLSAFAVSTALMAAAPLKVIERPMSPNRSSSRPADAKIDTVMLHFSSDVLRNPDDPFDVERVVGIYEQYGASAHYLIDRKGTVYRLVPESRVAFHAGKGELPWEPKRKDTLNRHSIGIELLGIGSERDMRIFMSADAYRKVKEKHPDYIGFTDTQYDALAKLIDDITSRHPGILRDRFHIVGHEEYAPARRSDPGTTFDWAKIGLTRERPATQPATGGAK